MKRFTAIFTIIVICLHVTIPVKSAPSSKNHHPTVYDQKQTGDYNIQLHLKDFQIIALLPGDAGLGDYDYSYDYSDFTVKPSTPKPPSSTTSFPTSIPTSPKPSQTQQPVISGTSTIKPLTVTIKPEVSTSKPQEISSKQPEETSLKLEATTSQPEITSARQEVSTSKVGLNDSKPLEELLALLSEGNLSKFKENDKNNANTEPSSTTIKNDKQEEIISPGKIKVQIIEAPLSPVPGEELTQTNDVNAAPQSSGVVVTRKCASGFSRDQRGRCRRVRKPSNSYLGFSRLANNLASRFVKDSARPSSEESAE